MSHGAYDGSSIRASLGEGRIVKSIKSIHVAMEILMSISGRERNDVGGGVVYGSALGWM